MKTIWITPEELFMKIKTWFHYKRKITFLSAFFCGLLFYFGAYSKGLTNPDGLWNSVLKASGDWEVSLGRFMLPIVDMIRGDAVANVLYSVIAIGILSLSVVWFLEYLSVDSAFWNACLAILMMSNQLIGTIVSYYYCSIAYAIGFAAAIFAVRVCYFKKESRYGRWRWFSLMIGWICIIISLGCYQSYIGVIALLILWTLLSMLFQRGITWKKFGKEVLQAFCLFAGGVAGYWICMKVSLMAAGITLADYKQANAIGLAETLRSFPKSVIKAYEAFGKYYFGNYFQVNGRLIMLVYLCLFLLAGFLLLMQYFQIWKNAKKKYDLVFKAVLAVVMIAGIPLAANMVLFAATGTDMMLLLTSGMLGVLPILVAYCIMRLQKWKIPMQSLAKWGVFVLVVLLIRNNVLVENTTQLALEEIHNRTYTMSARILEEIEKTPGYESDMRVCLNASTDDFPMTDEFARAGWMVREGAFWEDYDGTFYPWQKFFAHELGIKIEFVTKEEYRKIIESDAYQALSTFPKEGCTTIIDDVVVMKLTDTPAWQ